jgi:hypothetical protein
MKAIKITLEDQGQDFLELYVDGKTAKVIDVRPFQKSAWVDAIIPLDNKAMFKIGKLCPIHHPPHIKFGFLNYKIEKIEEVEYEN